MGEGLDCLLLPKDRTGRFVALFTGLAALVGCAGLFGDRMFNFSIVSRISWVAAGRFLSCHFARSLGCAEEMAPLFEGSDAIETMVALVSLCRGLKIFGGKDGSARGNSPVATGGVSLEDTQACWLATPQASIKAWSFWLVDRE